MPPINQVESNYASFPPSSAKGGWISRIIMWLRTEPGDMSICGIIMRVIHMMSD